MIELQVSNPFEASTRNVADGRFTVSLKQAMLSEHPSVMALARPGAPDARRGSLAAARHRASTVVSSTAASQSVASTTSGGMKDPKEWTAARKGRGSAGFEDTEAAAETMTVRAFIFVWYGSHSACYEQRGTSSRDRSQNISHRDEPFA